MCQQNDEGLEQPIAFFSQILHDYETRYSFVEKHVLAVIRSLKKFKHMLSNNKSHLLVAHPTVKEFFLNKDINDKRASWITRAMEYDIFIKVTKLVRGKGLCEQLVGSAENSKEEEKQVETVLNNEEQPIFPAVSVTWNQQIIHYLQTGGCLEDLDRLKRRYFKLQAISYALVDGILFKKDYNNILLRCIEPDQIEIVLKEFHEGPARGHFAARTIALKIMRAGYYWPELFKNTHSWVRK